MVMLQLLSKEAEPVVLSRKWGDSAYTHFDLGFSPRLRNWSSPWTLSSLPFYELFGFFWVLMLRLQGVRKFLIQDAVFSGFFTLFVCKATGGELYLFDYGSAVNLESGLLAEELNTSQPSPMTRIQLRIMRRIRFLSILSAKLFFVHSAEMKALALSSGLPVEQVVEYRFPLDSKVYRRDGDARMLLRRKFGVGRRFWVMYVGRMTLDKGLSLLVEAYAELVKAYPGRLGLVMVGSGPEKESLMKMCKGLEAVVFVDQVDSPVQVAEFMSAADVFVYPIVYSGGIAMAVLEAMSCQLPVVVGQAGPTKDVIVHGENGFVLREVKASSIVEAVSYLLKHPKVRDGIGRRARETVMDEHNVDEYERTVIERIL